ncbi:MAG: Crp/Fnr family transcriptional regulator [Terriglobia bacterium]
MELNFLLDRAVELHYAPGQAVFVEGDPCEGLYVIESGQIKIFRTSPNGREQILTIERAGASIAELPVFDGGNYPASAAALTESTLLHIRKHDFQALCLEHREVALKVLKVVGSRLRAMVNLINELSFASVRHRLASLLLRLAEDEGKRTGNGIVFDLSATNQELAAQIGTVRELVSRNLGRFQSMGIIRLKGKRVTVLDLKALQAEVEADG